MAGSIPPIMAMFPKDKMKNWVKEFGYNHVTNVLLSAPIDDVCKINVEMILTEDALAALCDIIRPVKEE